MEARKGQPLSLLFRNISSRPVINSRTLPSKDSTMQRILKRFVQSQPIVYCGGELLQPSSTLLKRTILCNRIRRKSAFHHHHCFTSRNEKYKGISLFKIPGGKDEYSTKWSKELLNIRTKYRIYDTKLRKLIESKRLYICERHIFAKSDHTS